MRNSIGRHEAPLRFSFEPIAEPGFELCLGESFPSQPGDMLVSVALDIKRVLDLTVPAAYRDNRVSLQFRTSRERLCRFVEQFSVEAASVLREHPQTV